VRGVDRSGLRPPFAVLGDLNVWGPLALAGGLSVAVGVAIGLVDAKLHRSPKPAVGHVVVSMEPRRSSKRRAA